MSMDRIDAIPDSLWGKLKAEPARAPETLALEAAERFAPQVEEWHRLAGHGKEGPALAAEAVRKHVRLSRLEGFALGFGGITTAALDTAALAWIQARMVLYVAAAYGFEPRDPMRPAELLALWGVYETPAQARESLDGLGPIMALAYADQKLKTSGHDRSAVLKALALKQVKKRSTRIVPLISAPIASVQNAADTKELGAQALKFYGG